METPHLLVHLFGSKSLVKASSSSSSSSSSIIIRILLHVHFLDVTSSCPPDLKTWGSRNVHTERLLRKSWALESWPSLHLTAHTWNPNILYFWRDPTPQNKAEIPIKTRVIWVPGRYRLCNVWKSSWFYIFTLHVCHFPSTERSYESYSNRSLAPFDQELLVRDHETFQGTAPQCHKPHNM